MNRRNTLCQDSSNACLVTGGNDGLRRAEVEAFIHARFASAYGADVDHFLPTLLALRDTQGDIQAAFGMRGGEQGPLFLEHYLDRPVESLIARHAQAPVDRRRIVEFGNLACANTGGARTLIAMLAIYLAGQEFHWITCTLGPLLYNSFRRMGLELVDLGPADSARLPRQEQARWGRYYEQRPRVMAGRIADAERLLSGLRRAGALNNALEVAA